MKDKATVTIQPAGDKAEVTTRSHTRVGARCYRVKNGSASQKRLEAVLERYGASYGTLPVNYGERVGIWIVVH